MPTTSNKPWENALLAYIAGSARTTQGIAGSVAEATKFIRRNAAEYKEKPEQQFNYKDIPLKVWNALTTDQRKQAFENSKAHSKQLSALTNPINDQAERVYAEAKATADKIKKELPAPYQPIRVVTEAIPSLLLSGGGQYKTAANIAQSVFNQVGQDRAVDLANLAPVVGVHGNSVKSAFAGQALQEIIPPIKEGLAEVYQRARKKAKTLVVK